MTFVPRGRVGSCSYEKTKVFGWQKKVNSSSLETRRSNGEHAKKDPSDIRGKDYAENPERALEKDKPSTSKKGGKGALRRDLPGDLGLLEPRPFPKGEESSSYAGSFMESSLLGEGENAPSQSIEKSLGSADSAPLFQWESAICGRERRGVLGVKLTPKPPQAVLLI